MGGYQILPVLLKEELDQLYEEGYDVDKDDFIRRINETGNERGALLKLYGQMRELRMRPDFRYVEPSEYKQIAAASRGGNLKAALPDDKKLYDSFYGAWLGRCIGCALGQPIESWSSGDIREWFAGAGAWPVAGYVPTHSAAEQKGRRLNNTDCTAENLRHMVTDDDIRYTVLALTLLEEKGFSFDAYDVGSHWMRHLPFDMVCTAERQAYQNFVNVDAFNQWNRPEDADAILRESRVNTYLNPYREWIGAQIRVDAYGWAAAGDPHRAAWLAYQDASLSHVKNGVYGAMFFCAMIAAAFAIKDVDELYSAAIREVPAGSRFHEAMERAFQIGKAAGSQEDVAGRCGAEFGHYSVAHTINNAAICLSSIIFSKGDFEKAVTTAVACGQDTDCNGATVGSVMGALAGEPRIAGKWKLPMNDLLYSGIPGYHPVKISGLAKKSMEQFKKYNAAQR